MPSDLSQNPAVVVSAFVLDEDGRSGDAFYEEMGDVSAVLTDIGRTLEAKSIELQPGWTIDVSIEPMEQGLHG